MKTMKGKYKTVRAFLYGCQDATIRLKVPADFAAETTAGHREIAPGIIHIGHHTGRRWGLVQTYSCWTCRDGSAQGSAYTAYDLRDPADRAAYAIVLADSHYTDFDGGNVNWFDLLEGACARNATEDERRRLVDAGYSADDAERAAVWAENGRGERLYRIPHNGYAVEGETGEIITDLDATEAVRQWA